MDEINEIAVETETLEQTTETEVETAPKRRGRKPRSQSEETLEEAPTTFHPGDHVTISARVGAFLDGTPMTESMRHEYYTVISESKGTVTLYDQSKIFKRKLSVNYLKRVESK